MKRGEDTEKHGNCHTDVEVDGGVTGYKPRHTEDGQCATRSKAEARKQSPLERQGAHEHTFSLIWYFLSPEL